MLSTVCAKDTLERQAPFTPSKANREPVIFVVEDDPRVRRFICTLLRQTTTAAVAEAEDPCTALLMARTSGAPIDLLISDINLSPFINGVDLAHELALTNPSMNVLLMSAADYPQGEIPPAWRFLLKPFSIQSLLDCVSVLCRFVTPVQNVRAVFRPVIDNIP
jgi:DNA-binding response OmpR family regulator